VTLAGNAPMEHGLQSFIDKRVGALAGHEERLVVRPEERGDEWAQAKASSANVLRAE
jgi:hypothetical protein